MKRLNRKNSTIKIFIHTILISLLLFHISKAQTVDEKKYFGTFKSANPYMMSKSLYGDKIPLKANDRPQLFDIKDGKIKVMVNGEYGYVYQDDLKSDQELIEFKNMIANGLVVLNEQEKIEEAERRRNEENQSINYTSIKSSYGDSSIFIVRARNNDVALFETPNGKVITEKLPLYEPLKVIKFYDKNYVKVRGVNDKSIFGYVLLYFIEKEKGLEQWVIDEELKEQKENERLTNEKLRIEKEKRLKESNIKKEKRLKELTALYGPDKAKKLINGELWIGMTVSEAIESKGTPKRINETVTADGKKQQFVYDDLYLYFEKGVLTTYQKSY